MSGSKSRGHYKRAYSDDIYETWIKLGKLDEVLEFITECSRKCISQQEMCKELKLSPQTFSSMKKKYPKLQEAMDKAKFELKKDLVGAMYKKAIGFEITEEDQLVQEKDGKQVRKIHRIKKEVGPDYKAITYLLTKNFGVTMAEKYEEALLSQEIKSKTEEEWESEKEEDENEH